MYRWTAITLSLIAILALSACGGWDSTANNTNKEDTNISTPINNTVPTEINTTIPTDEINTTIPTDDITKCTFEQVPRSHPSSVGMHTELITTKISPPQSDFPYLYTL